MIHLMWPPSFWHPDPYGTAAAGPGDGEPDGDGEEEVVPALLGPAPTPRVNRTAVARTTAPAA